MMKSGAHITEADLESAVARLVTWDQRRHLVAELRRLRRLLVKTAHRNPYLGPECPRVEGRCWWCGARLEGVAPEPHKMPSCPWPELKRETLDAIEGSGRG